VVVLGGWVFLMSEAPLTRPRQVAHRHASDERNYVHGVDTVTGSYAAVIPIKNLA